MSMPLLCSETGFPLIEMPGHPLDIGLDFELPPELSASEPPEARGLARDEVRLMVSYRTDDHAVHTTFRHLEEFLAPGDLVVINTSGTLNAALNAKRADGSVVALHLSTHLPANLWLVEVRLLDGPSTRPFFDAQAGETLHLPAEATATLLAPYSTEEQTLTPTLSQKERTSNKSFATRLWVATLNLTVPLNDYLAEYGFPIRYSYVPQRWSSSTYQTVYATEMGSAEMPSAGRAFTPEIITRLVARGVQIAPLILHTGVASLEAHETPYEEYYRVPLEAANAVNAAHAAGKRVVAVGTTVVRALETVTDRNGTTHPGEGWTRLVITPQRGIQAVNALLTGLHEPRASHLAMLAALAGKEHLRLAYQAALDHRYLWHEFGDLHLIL